MNIIKELKHFWHGCYTEEDIELCEAIEIGNI